MTQIVPEIEVEITFYSTSQDGKKGLTQGEYRGVLGVGSEHFSVRLFINKSEMLDIPKKEIFDVQFLFPDAALEHFKLGTKFSVWEGKCIGEGVVLKVYNAGGVA